MAGKEEANGEQEKMAREREMSDTIGKAVGAHFNRFREEFGNEILGKMGEMLKQSAAPRQEAAPAQQRMTEQDLRDAQAYFAQQGIALVPMNQAGPRQPMSRQEEEPEEVDYSPVVDDMVDTLRDANP